MAIFPKSNKIVMAQMDSKVPLQTFEKVMKTAMDGCHMIYEKMSECVKERALDLLETRGTFS